MIPRKGVTVDRAGDQVRTRGASVRDAGGTLVEDGKARE